MSFVDDFSGIIFVYFLKRKSDALAAAKRFLADVAPFGTVRRFRCDNGTEYTSSDFKSLLIDNKIRQEFSAPYSSFQNGTAERAWRSLMEMARCLILEANLPKELWNYALRASAYIRNRCFNPRTGKTAYEMFTGKTPNLSNMNTFGTICYAYTQNKKKLDPRCKEGIFVGYDPCSPAYLIYFPDSCEVKRVRCVKFVNSEIYDNVEYEIRKAPVSEGNPPTKSKLEEEKLRERTPEPEEAAVEHPELELQESSTKGGAQPRRSKREKNKPKYLQDYEDPDDLDMANTTIDCCYRVQDIPASYSEAMLSPESAKWKKAMDEEMSSLVDNDTYELTPVPEGRSVVGGRWVYAVKLGPKNQEKFKARYVAKGYSQIENVDYTETFSPTARVTSIRMLMQLAIQEGHLVHQMDVKTAYLNADIDCELYVQQPEGFIRAGNNGDKLVCKLKKSLYGLKQSGRMWNNMLHKYLLDEQFVQ
jgi:hypothetical protein